MFNVSVFIAVLLVETRLSHSLLASYILYSIPSTLILQRNNEMRKEGEGEQMAFITCTFVFT